MSAPWTFFGVVPGDGRGQQIPQTVLDQVIVAIITTPAPTSAKENAVRGVLNAAGASDVAAETDEYMRDTLGAFVILDAEAALIIPTMFQG